MKIIPKNKYQIPDYVKVISGDESEHYFGFVIGIELHRMLCKLTYTIMHEQTGKRTGDYEEKDFYKIEL